MTRAWYVHSVRAAAVEGDRAALPMHSLHSRFPHPPRERGLQVASAAKAMERDDIIRNKLFFLECDRFWKLAMAVARHNIERVTNAEERDALLGTRGLIRLTHMVKQQEEGRLTEAQRDAYVSCTPAY